MKEVFLIYFFVCLCSIVLGSSDEDGDLMNVEEDYDDENAIDRVDNDGQTDLDSKVPTTNCWMSLNAAKHFLIMDKIDEHYESVREKVQESVKNIDFDKTIIDELVRSRGVATREKYARQQQISMIPSGFNLGGNCMMRMPDSVLFFHRMKLRNNTYFGLELLYNDLSKMTVTINLSLNDLHLKGAFERSLTNRDPSELTYTPTLGHIEFLLKDVRYNVEGRYRLINNKLLVELVSSKIYADDIMMTYITKGIESSAIRIERGNLGSFMSRLQTDLDKWIKDYFNDYLINVELDQISNMEGLAKYDKEKVTALEEFTDESIKAIARRIRFLNAESISLPTFTFKATTGVQIKLYEGAINGLDSMYRRSVATGCKQDSIRKVDCVVGFSNLKVVYKYDARIPSVLPPLSGVLTLSSNELAAHLALRMVSYPETVDLDINFLDQMKPESLTMEGSANIMISNFKHLLEHQIVATMSNTLIHGIELLKALPRCEPFELGQIKDKKELKPKQLNDYFNDASESEEMLRGKTNPQRRSTRHSKSIMKHSNKSIMKKNKKELKKYKRKSKKSYNSTQDIL